MKNILHIKCIYNIYIRKLYDYIYIYCLLLYFYIYVYKYYK